MSNGAPTAEYLVYSAFVAATWLRISEILRRKCKVLFHALSPLTALELITVGASMSAESRGMIADWNRQN